MTDYRFLRFNQQFYDITKIDINIRALVVFEMEKTRELVKQEKFDNSE